MKILKVAGLSILALSLILGVASPALATPDLASPQAIDTPPKTFKGMVTEIYKDSFIIKSGEVEVTISVDDDTRYVWLFPPQRVVALARERLELRQRIREELEQALTRHRVELRERIQERLEQALPRHPELKQRIQEKLEQVLPEHQLELQLQSREKLTQQNLQWLRHFAEEATFDDITPGTWVVVRAVATEDNPLAKVVFILEPTMYQCVTGTVTDIALAGETITIVPADGSDAITLKYNERTRFILRGTIRLEEGQSVRAVYAIHDNELIAKAVFAPIEAPELAD